MDDKSCYQAETYQILQIMLQTIFSSMCTQTLAILVASPSVNNLCLRASSQSGKKTSAVRETSVSRYTGDQVRAPLKPEKTIVLYWSAEFQGAQNCAPIMQKNASLSDSYKSDHCCFSSLS